MLQIVKFLWFNFYYSKHVREVHFWNVTTVQVATTGCIACRNRKAQKKSSENARSCYYCCTARWIAWSCVSFCSVASFLFSVRAKLNKKRQCVRKAIREVQVFWWAGACVEGQWTVMFTERLIKMYWVLLLLVLLIDGLYEEKTDQCAGLGVSSRCWTVQR